MIPFKVPGNPAQVWHFYDYCEGDSNPIQDWYLKELSEDGRLGLNALLKNTCKVANHLEWVGFKYLKGEPKKEAIWQVDFIADKRQYRVLGVFGVGSKNAAVVMGCYHKGDVYTPHSALETAVKRAKALREGRAGLRERKIRMDF